MTGNHWGRLQVDIDCQLRRGAWYRVTELESLQAILDVNRRRLAIPHYLIEVVSAPPRRWTVVPRPQNARVLPKDWGAAYAVCPSCRERAALRDARAGWTAAVATESSTSPGTKPTSRTDAGAPLTERGALPTL